MGNRFAHAAEETDQSDKLQVKLIRERAANTVRRRVFGVSLQSLYCRRNAFINDIPIVIYKATKILETRLKTEGLFRGIYIGVLLQDRTTEHL